MSRRSLSLLLLNIRGVQGVGVGGIVTCISNAICDHQVLQKLVGLVKDVSRHAAMPHTAGIWYMVFGILGGIVRD